MAEEETEDRDWPELLSDVSVVGGAGHGAGLPRLKRGQGSRHLGVDMTFNPDEEEGTEQRNKYFTSSGKLSKKAVKHRHKHHTTCIYLIMHYHTILTLSTEVHTEVQFYFTHRRGPDQTHPDRWTELLSSSR